MAVSRRSGDEIHPWSPNGHFRPKSDTPIVGRPWHDAKGLSAVLAAPHRHLPEFQPNSNYTHQPVLWAFGSTIH